MVAPEIIYNILSQRVISPSNAMSVCMGSKYWAQKVQYMKGGYRLPSEQKNVKLDTSSLLYLETALKIIN